MADRGPDRRSEGRGNEALASPARLDRLPILAFHRRLLWLIGAGMFFDSFDIYLAGSVLGELVHNGWSSIPLNARFISATFIGMVIGAARGRLARRPLRAQVHLSVQSGDLRRGLARLRGGARHGLADRRAVRRRHRARRGDRHRLRDHAGVHAALASWPLGGVAVAHDQFRPVRLDAAELADHPGVRLAADVRASPGSAPSACFGYGRRCRNRRAGSS